jgi:hypothetical protein
MLQGADCGFICMVLICMCVFEGYLQGAYFEGQDIGRSVADCVLHGGCIGLEHVELVRNASPYQD